MRVYLDNNASTAIAPEVLARMTAVLSGGPLNPGSLHQSGQRARQLFREAGNAVPVALGLTNRQTVFVASGTEAINLVLRGQHLAAGPIVLSSVEHPAVDKTAEALGVRRVIAVSRTGQLDLEGLKASLPGARLACFMAANNETGGVLPLVEISNLCRFHGVPLMVDASQAPGKMDLRGVLDEADPDFLVLSGHKMHAPVGIAALVLRSEAKLRQQTTGGGQQHGLRAGTEPVALAAGFAHALELAVHHTDFAKHRARCAALFDAIRAVAPQAVRTIPDPEQALANTLHYRIPGLEAQRQVVAFDMAGIECSSASACESGASLPSRVLLRMGYTEAESREGIRMSVGRLTTDAEIAFATDTMKSVLSRMLRGTSP
jgi:cysteine sulfinate desulfinase/cysteine desulfurase-like protein